MSSVVFPILSDTLPTGYQHFAESTLIQDAVLRNLQTLAEIIRQSEAQTS